MITINEKLHLVMPLYSSSIDGVDTIYAYVHSAPISREIFEANFLLISKTFAAIHGEGLGEIAGPRVSAMMMKTVAARMAGNTDPATITEPLLNEIRRLTNVLLNDGQKWEILPYQDAVNRKLFQDDDASEVENALVFFTVLSAMHRKKTLEPILSGAARLWGAEISSLGCSAFIASLPTSIAIANTGSSSTPKTPEKPPAPKAGPVVDMVARLVG